MDSFHPAYNPKLTIYDRSDLGSNPSGNVLLASFHHSGASAPEEHWLSPATLEDLQVETADTAHCCQAVGNEQVVYRVSAPKLAPVFVRSKGGQPHPLCTKCFGREAAFLDDQWVVVAGVPSRRFLIVSTGGEIKVDETLGKKDDLIAGISVAPIARQIAFVLIPEHLKSTPGNFLVCIYDTALKKVTFQIQIPQRIRRDPPWAEVYSGAPAVALSPDGKSLAILDDSMLRIYAMSP
jgi:hypothetical protein